MGNCTVCGESTRDYCVVCLLFACTKHLPMHYISQQHRGKALAQQIALDENGVPQIQK